ncbi:MAG: ABC transporter ATP-binding protein [Candidatus Izemoplasmatales bacterium]|jgi:fluoroquinolone transport system ATP-binding protein
MIEIRTLNFAYHKTRVIKDMNLTIHKGEIFGLLGPSGAGKSTVQRIMIGSLRTYEGSVRLFAKEAKELKDRDYHLIGVQPEVPQFYSKYTALENLKFFSSMYEGVEVDISYWVKRVGLEEDIHKRVSDYSKGMKTRLNFIRSVLHHPSILFLDEPTSGLDPINQKIIKDIIQEMNALGVTIVITTHNMKDVEDLCHRIAFINHGKILAEGAINEFLHASPLHQIRVVVEDSGLLETEVVELKHLFTDKYKDLAEKNKIRLIQSDASSLNDVFIRLAEEGDEEIVQKSLE